VDLMTTTSPNAQALEQQLAPLAARLAALQEAKEKLTEQEEQIKARIRELVPAPDTYAAGELQVSVQTNGRLDTKAIAEKYPYDAHPELYGAPAIDTKKVRAHFAPVELEPLTTYGTPKVMLR
jgi:hypothetical protein